MAERPEVQRGKVMDELGRPLTRPLITRQLDDGRRQQHACFACHRWALVRRSVVMRGGGGGVGSFCGALAAGTQAPAAASATPPRAASARAAGAGPPACLRSPRPFGVAAAGGRRRCLGRWLRRLRGERLPLLRRQELVKELRRGQRPAAAPLVARLGAAAAGGVGRRGGGVGETVATARATDATAPGSAFRRRHEPVQHSHGPLPFPGTPRGRPRS